MQSIERLREAVRTVPALFSRITDEASGRRPAPGKWSQREVLGHLIDSAANNHQRFVRAGLTGHVELPGYEQDAWVRLQAYQDAPWKDVIDLWRAYNTHLLHVLARLSPEAKRATCRVGDGAPMTLEALADDYVRHLEHHLTRSFPEWAGRQAQS